MNFDFGYTGGQSSEGTTSQTESNEQNVTNLETGGEDVSKNGEDTTPLNNSGENSSEPNEPTKTEESDSDSSYDEGTTIEVDGQTYTIDKNGNAVDKDGNVFKEKNDIDEWIKSYETVEENNSDNTINITSIQEALGVDIVDDNGQSVTFDNTPDGIKSYVDAVIQTQQDENYKTAIDSLFAKYPVLEDVLNYYVANGNSLNGYGEVPDRSGITIDDTNEAQQEQVIRMSWEEQGRGGDVDSYIQYLKSSGTLLNVAKSELEYLQKVDEDNKDRIAKEAQQREEDEQRIAAEYWGKVKDVIDSKQIGKYRIPDTILVNRNGQKITASVDDFYRYVYMVDANGESQYSKDLKKISVEDKLQDDILRAYLTFVGGDYSNLVDMAINDEKVKNLKLKAKKYQQSSVRITKPTPKQSKPIDFGYN